MDSLNEVRWKAVKQRDEAAASAFVYAVITTGVFCRPTCPSRLARRSNIRFYDSPAAATLAHFRPCKRCKPEEDVPPDPVARLVSAACNRILDSEGQITVRELATLLGVSIRYMDRVLSREIGCTPASYAARIRQSKLAGLSSSFEGTSIVEKAGPNVDSQSQMRCHDEHLFPPPDLMQQSGAYDDPRSYEFISDMFIDTEQFLLVDESSCTLD